MADPISILLVGDGPVVDALDPLCTMLGWSTAVTATQVPVAADVDALVVTSHHDDVDGPMIRAALAAGTAYVGAMGSRATQARRREWLVSNGVQEASLQRLHAPIGLDIGAQEPGEIAVSIVAQIVALRRGALDTVGSVSDRDGPIHPDLGPGEAYCPGG